MIEIISFHPISKKADSSLIGFCSFQWGNDFQFQEIGVHRLLTPRNNLKVRLLYPKNARPKGIIYNQILQEINSYIVANYNEALNA